MENKQEDLQMKDLLRKLFNRGWELKPGGWENPEYTHQGLPLVFTFEQVCKKEGL